MKKAIICAFLISSFVLCSSCSNNGQNTNKNTLNLNNETITEDNSEDTTSILDGEVFEKLPDEALDSFNTVSETSKKIFPDAQGEWMYGYKGTEKIDECNCYVFVLYTHKGKSYSKVGTIAKKIDGDTLYIKDELTEKFSKAVIPEETTSWANTNTLVFAKTK